MINKFKCFIFSADPDQLIRFYTKILGLKIVNELKLPKDYGYMVEVAPGYEIWIAKHSKVKGYNADPYRHFINLYTDQVQDYYNRVQKVKGVKIVQKPVKMDRFNPVEKRYVCTFLDPEGNCLQVMGELGVINRNK